MISRPTDPRTEEDPQTLLQDRLLRILVQDRSPVGVTDGIHPILQTKRTPPTQSNLGKGYLQNPEDQLSRSTIQQVNSMFEVKGL